MIESADLHNFFSEGCFPVSRRATKLCTPRCAKPFILTETSSQMIIGRLDRFAALRHRRAVREGWCAPGVGEADSTEGSPIVFRCFGLILKWVPGRRQSSMRRFLAFVFCPRFALEAGRCNKQLSLGGETS